MDVMPIRDVIKDLMVASSRRPFPGPRMPGLSRMYPYKHQYRVKDDVIADPSNRYTAEQDATYTAINGGFYAMPTYV